MRSTLVGMRTGPLTRRRFSLAPLIRSAHTVQGGEERRGERPPVCVEVAAVARRGWECRRTLLQVGDVAGGEGDPDAVHPGSLLLASLALRLGRLVCSRHLKKGSGGVET
jgi:hypothetical protein